MARTSLNLDSKKTRTVLPDVEWHRGFGRRIADLLRRYAGEECPVTVDAATWWNRPWSDADRVAARRIDINSF